MTSCEDEGKGAGPSAGTALDRVAKLGRKSSDLFHGSRCSDSTNPPGRVPQKCYGRKGSETASRCTSACIVGETGQRKACLRVARGVTGTGGPKSRCNKRQRSSSSRAVHHKRSAVWLRTSRAISGFGKPCFAFDFQTTVSYLPVFATSLIVPAVSRA